MASLLTRPLNRAGAIVAAIAIAIAIEGEGAGAGEVTGTVTVTPTDPHPPPKQPAQNKRPVPLPTTTTTAGPSRSPPAPARVPGWLTSPRRRLRWLYARICSERHDRAAARFGDGDGGGGGLLGPDPASREPRPRSFREILGRKLLEAEAASASASSSSYCFSSSSAFPGSISVPSSYPFPCASASAPGAPPPPPPPPPLAELLERAAENLFLMAWWKGEWLCYALVWWAFGALVPARWQWLAAAPWWWGDAVCAWWAEVLVARAGAGVRRLGHPSLREVWASVGRGDAVIAAAAGRGSPDRWGVVAGRLDDLVELTRILCDISWCFVCFYLWAAKARLLAYPRCVARSACRALGVDVPRCRLDIELLELD